MRSKLLLIVTALLICPTLSAENNPLWVVGSFSSEELARLEIERIEGTIGLDPHLVQAISKGQEVFRLVIEKPSRQSDQQQTKAALAAIGIEGVWRLPGVRGKPVIEKTQTSDQMAISTPEPEAIPAPETIPEPEPPPEPEPEPEPPVVARIKVPEVVSPEQLFATDSHAYFDFCTTMATAYQRKDYCGNREFDSRVRKELTPRELELIYEASL